MSYARASLKGVTFYNSRCAYNGLTLLTPVEGSAIWLIDMLGRSVKCWQVPYPPAGESRLLPNGNLLYAGKTGESVLPGMEGAGGIILELGWEGEVVWEYRDLHLHDGFCRLENGNTLLIKWVEVPSDIAAGVLGSEPESILWGDIIQEVAPSGKVVWEWVAHEHLKAEEDVPCLLCPRSEWTHLNGVDVFENGDILVSFMKINTIAIVDKKSGTLKWRWGPGELAHQHSPSVLSGGNILVFDNGFHPYGFPWGYSRVVEVDPRSGNMVWSYGGGKVTTEFYSATMSSCQRLPNRNTLICEGNTGRIFEVDLKGELVWEFGNYFPQAKPRVGSLMVYTAYRYGMDYPGLKKIRG